MFVHGMASHVEELRRARARWAAYLRRAQQAGEASKEASAKRMLADFDRQLAEAQRCL